MLCTSAEMPFSLAVMTALLMNMLYSSGSRMAKRFNSNSPSLEMVKLNAIEM